MQYPDPHVVHSHPIPEGTIVHHGQLLATPVPHNASNYVHILQLLDAVSLDSRSKYVQLERNRKIFVGVEDEESSPIKRAFHNSSRPKREARSCHHSQNDDHQSSCSSRESLSSTTQMGVPTVIPKFFTRPSTTDNPLSPSQISPTEVYFSPYLWCAGRGIS